MDPASSARSSERDLAGRLPTQNAPERTPRKERGTFGGTCGGTSHLEAISRQAQGSMDRQVANAGPLE